MDTNLLFTYLILGIIGLVSWKGFYDSIFKEKYLFSPYIIKVHNEWYRFISHTFLHGDIGHLLFNCIAVYYFGGFIETYFDFQYPEPFGKITFIVFILLAMIFSSLYSYFKHINNPGYRSIGFSGVTSAFLFAAILLAPTMNIGMILLPVSIPAYLFAPLYLAFEFWASKKQNTTIAHDAHIGGAIFGVVFILITNIEQVKISINSIFS